MLKPWSWSVPVKAEEGVGAVAQQIAHAAAANKPVVIRDMVKTWPLVIAGREDSRLAIAHIQKFDRNVLAKTMMAPPEALVSRREANLEGQQTAERQGQRVEAGPQPPVL